MRQRSKLLIAFVTTFITTLLLQPTAPALGGSVAVLTRSYDNSRTGANLAETRLNTANINPQRFGKLFTRPVVGQIYAQPLYVPDLDVAGRSGRNVVFVATMHNNVYAFDADDPNANQPLWERNLGASAPLPDLNIGSQYGPYKDILVEVGIISTPVIEPATNTIYVVAFVKTGVGQYEHRLHALNILSGQDKANSPMKIEAQADGYGSGGANGKIGFRSNWQLQRAGLLLSKGVVYIAFASYGDSGDYHGWVLGYDARTLAQVCVFNVTPDGGAGGIWMSGQGISADANGDLYLVTGNGTFNAHEKGNDYGNAILKLRPVARTLEVVSWFVPYNYKHLNNLDLDLGSTGALLIPGTDLALAGSKQGKFYLVSRTNMGGFQPDSDKQVVQSFQASTSRHIHGSPVFWQTPTSPTVYIWSENDRLRAFRFKDGKFETTPYALSQMAVPDGMPGGILSVSANGSLPGSGIIWAAHPANGDARLEIRPGILRAFDASNVGIELWNSLQVPERDDMGNLAKFNPPVVVNGKVYMATFSNQLVVYGLLPRYPNERGGRY